MRFLSARRRHPLAGLVVVLLGLFVAAGVYAAVAPSSDASASNEDLVSQGHQIFLVGCATCHGLNGEGTMTSADTNYGPPLVGVGAAAVDFQVGTGRMPMAQPGTQALAKPPQYDEAEIEALAAYIASLGPGPFVPSAKYYDVTNATQEQVVNGGELFRTNCTACHNFSGSGGPAPRPVRPAHPRRRAEIHIRGDGHGATADAGLLRRCDDPTGQARHHRLCRPSQPSTFVRGRRPGRSRSNR